MARKAEQHNERREQSGPSRQKASSPSSSATEFARKKRRPRGSLFHGDDPTLAKRVEEELHTFGR